MPLTLPQNLRVWNEQPGDPPHDLTSNDAKKRYGRGKQKRVIGGQEFAHPNVHGDAVPGSASRVNELIVAGTTSTVPGLAEALLSLGYSTGERISEQDYLDMDMFIENATYSVQLASGWSQVTADWPVLWRIHIPWLNAMTGQVTPAPTPQPPLSTGEQGSELFESGHEISAKLPKGSRQRRAVGAFETAWGACRALAAQAITEGISGVDQLLGITGPAFEGLLRFFEVLNKAAQEGRDFIVGVEREEGQQGLDQYWDTIHQVRKIGKDTKATGWQLVAGDPRPAVFQYSRFNRIAWTGLSNITVSAGLYGLQGELIKSGPLAGQREPQYVDAFENWETQDPLRETTTGDGGINLPGQSLSDAIK